MPSVDFHKLKLLSRQFPDANSALAEAAVLRARLTLPRGVTHIISDVHGDYQKLRHVINNASGSLRPFVERVFRDRLTEDEQRQLLNVLYYPREYMAKVSSESLQTREARMIWVKKILRQLFELIRHLAPLYPRTQILERVQSHYRPLFEELLYEPASGRDEQYVDAMIGQLNCYDRDLPVVRAASRLVRNLAVSEIVVAGDLGDRGPRIDRVIDFLQSQPRVALVWGNHDVTWMGACLGQPALIATVLRMSLRYQRLWQLEEGYGLILTPLERLVEECYADDPATQFLPHGEGGLRDSLKVARMQKAAAILEFKLTGQLIERHPEWEMEDRNLLPRLDLSKGTIQLDGLTYPLIDTHFPTLDPSSPNTLNKEERRCMDRLRESFVNSQRLWDHMSWMVREGGMVTTRDHAVIFHACVPVDEHGKALALNIEGETCEGRRLFEKFESIIRRAYRKTANRLDQDADWFWYLWAGPKSPLFGKDKLTTFERYFIEDPITHEETKNPYFKLIHQASFCEKMAAEMGVHEFALIVNGHVPVRIEHGESPVKKGGNAVTIDGAFSQAYGDRGYTLVLSSENILLAEHHHFESIDEVLDHNADILPTTQVLRQYSPPLRVQDTALGRSILEEIETLENLVEAYQNGGLRERVSTAPNTW